PAGGNAQTLGFVVPDVLSYTANNNIPGTLTLNALAFANPFGQTGSGTVTIGGNPITFDGGAGSGFVTQNALGAVVITSNLSFANPNTALVFNGAAPGLVQLAGPLGQITGSPTNSIVINTHPLGVTSFEASNPNFQGPVTLASGTVRLTQPGGLGVNASNTIAVAGPNTLLNLAFNSGTIAGNVNLFGGDLNLAGITGTGQPNFLGGQISGSGGLVVHSGLISPTNAANNFTGDVRVFGGRLVIGSVAGAAPLGAGTNPIQLGRPYGSGGVFGASNLFLDNGAAAGGGVTAAGSFSGAEIQFTGAGALTFGRPIVVNPGSGTLASINNAAGAVTFDPGATVTHNRPLLVNPGAGTTFNGAITGPGGLFLNLGVAALNGPNTYSGGTVIENTTVNVG